MTFDDAYQWLQQNRTDVNQLWKAGDKMALGIMTSYNRWYQQRNPALADEFVKRVEEYIRRELMIDDRMKLMNKYGYKLQT